MLLLCIGILIALIGGFLFCLDADEPINYVGILGIATGVFLIETAEESIWMLALSFAFLAIMIYIAKSVVGKTQEDDSEDFEDPRTFAEKVLYYQRLTRSLNEKYPRAKTELMTMVIEFGGNEYRYIKFSTDIRKKKLSKISSASWLLDACKKGRECVVELYEVA